MKNINKSSIILSLAIGLMIGFSSCKKDNTTVTVPVTYGTMLFHLHTNVDTNEVDTYGQVYTMTGGRRITVTKAQLYISGVQLEQANGTWVGGPGINLLKVQENEVYTVGSVASGNYKTVKFNIGLSAATNAAAPSPSDPVLYRKDMWFDSTSFTGGGGFVFVDFEGTIDTAATPSPGNALIPFIFRIGTNANLESVTMPDQNYSISQNQATEVHMIIDYSKLFTGVQMNQGLHTVTTAAENASWTWAQQVALNIPSMFRYEY